MLRRNGETEPRERVFPKELSVTQTVISKILNSRRERPGSAAAQPEFGFISLKG
jgi:hypothetical protein